MRGMATVPEKLVSALVVEDPEMADIVREFVGGLANRAREMGAALSAQDWDRLRTLAHQLKGAGGSYGYPDLSRLGADMEKTLAGQRGVPFAAWLEELSALIRAAEAGLS